MNHKDINNWLQVATDGNPDDGLYVAMYKDRGNNLIIALIGYYPNEGCGSGYEDEDGETQYGWAESPRTDEESYIVRNVVAYLPHNYDMDALVAVRSALGGT